MKTDPASSWSTTQSEDFYGFKRWGSGHFSVGENGQVHVDPLADGRKVSIKDVIDEAVEMGMQAPFVIRFQDLLRHPVEQLNLLFRKAIGEED